jgi:hypothetical protein
MFVLIQCVLFEDNNFSEQPQDRQILGWHIFQHFSAIIISINQYNNPILWCNICFRTILCCCVFLLPKSLW